MTAHHCPDCGQEVSPGAVACPQCGRPLDAGAQAEKHRSPPRWLAIVGWCLLAVVLASGLGVAFLISSFSEMFETARQKRTSVALTDWGLLIEDYRRDHDGAVPAVASVDELAVALGLEGAEAPPAMDGWQHPLRYDCWSTSGEGGGCDTYRMVSAGRDGVFEVEDPALYEPGTFGWSDHDADMVTQDGLFIRYPGAAT